MLTPKAIRLERLMAQGKSFNRAFAIADREYTEDGMGLKTAHTDTVLSSGLPQMGEVQI